MIAPDEFPDSFWDGTEAQHEYGAICNDDNQLDDNVTPGWSIY